MGSEKGEESPPSPPSPNAAAARTAGPEQKVHPLAKKLAGLLSPMSLKDQQAASFWCNALIVGSLVVSFPVAYWLQNLFLAVFGVLGGALAAMLVCVPNWRQRHDMKLKFADDRDVWDYYEELKRARAGPASAPPKGNDKAAG